MLIDACINKIHWCVAVCLINGRQHFVLQITPRWKLLMTLYQSSMPKSHIGRESRFLPYTTCPHWNIAITFGIEKLERYGEENGEKKFEDIIAHFDWIHEHGRWTDGQTLQRLQLHIASRGKKSESKQDQHMNVQWQRIYHESQLHIQQWQMHKHLCENIKQHLAPLQTALK